MIVAKVKEGNVQLFSDGNLAELKADTLTVVEALYRALKEKSEDAAESFKNDIIENIEVAFMTEEEFIKSRGQKIIDSITEEIKERLGTDENINFES